MHLFFIPFIMIVFLGCGGGGTVAPKKDPVQTETLQTSHGVAQRTKQATLSTQNQTIFTQAIYDLTQIREFLSPIPFSSYVSAGIVVKNDTDIHTELGPITITLDDYYGVSGILHVEMLDVNNSTKFQKYRLNTSNLHIKKEDFDVYSDIAFTTESYLNDSGYVQSSKTTFETFRVDDKHANRKIEFQNLIHRDKYTQQQTKDDYEGEVIDSEEGSLHFKSHEQSFTLKDKEDNTLHIQNNYSTIDTRLNKDEKRTLYVNWHKLTTNKPPVFTQFLTLTPPYPKTLQDVTVTYALSGASSVTHIWSINDKEVANFHAKTLPASYYKKGDNVAVKVIASFLDAKTEQSTSTTIERSEIKITLKNQDHYESIIYPTNKKSFILKDLFDISNPDGEKLYYMWSGNGFEHSIIFDKATQYTQTPKITIEDFATYSMELDVMTKEEKQRLDKAYTKDSFYQNYSIDQYYKIFGSKVWESFSIDFRSDFFDYHDNNTSAITDITSNTTIADVNHDGLQDIIFSTLHNEDERQDKLVVMYQNADTSFQEPRIYTLPLPITKTIWDIACQDINADGRNDIIVSAAKSLIVYYQKSDGSLQEPIVMDVVTYEDTNLIKIADMNDDGLNDIILVEYSGPEDLEIIYLLEQKTDHSFKPKRKISDKIDGIGKITIADINNDNRKDIITRKLVLLQTALGTYVKKAYNMPQNEYAADYTVIDFDDDGKKDDIVMSLIGKKFGLFSMGENGEDFLEPRLLPVNKSPYALLSGDIDGDGKEELISKDKIYFIKDGMLDENRYELANKSRIRTLLVKDINNDNKDDIIAIYNIPFAISVGLSKE